MERHHYLYAHIRPDTNEVFYIGVGTKPKKYSNYGTEYRRAYSKSKKARNFLWFKIFIKNNHKRTVIILHESTNLSYIKQLEREYVKFYGKIIDKTGTLTNLVDGGGVNKGWLPSDKTIQKMKNNNWAKVHAKGMLNPNHNEYYVYTIDGKFVSKQFSMRELKSVYGINLSAMLRFRRKLIVQAKGYRVFTSYQGEQIEPLLKTGNKIICKPVAQYDKHGIVINTYPSATKAALTMNVSKTSICYAIKFNKRCKTYYWKYV